MLSKCANPACSTPFRRLREGKLFVVETDGLPDSMEATPRRARPLRRVEHYWLCDECSAFITLTFDRERGVIAVPLPDGTAKRLVPFPSSLEPAGDVLRPAASARVPAGAGRTL